MSLSALLLRFRTSIQCFGFKKAAFLSFVLAALITFEAQVLSNFLSVPAEVLMDVTTARTTPREQTAVILITDNDSPEITAAWPLPYSAYETFLWKAWCYGARSVYFDIGFLSARNRTLADPELERFVKAIDFVSNPQQAEEKWQQTCGAMKGVTPRKDPKMFVALPELRGEPERSMLAAHQRSSLINPNNTYAPIMPGFVEGSFQTAAFAVLKNACNGSSPPAGCARTYDVKSALRVRDSSFTPAAQSLFSVPTDSPMEACYYNPDEDKSLNKWYRIGRSLIGRPLNDALLCPPILTVTWLQFFTLPAQDIATQLHGRDLFVGGYLHGIQDSFRTPYHEALPGVYAHALVAEQLLSGNGAPYIQILWGERLGILWAAILLGILANVIYQIITGAHHTTDKKKAIRIVCGTGFLLIVVAYRFIGEPWPLVTAVRDAMLFVVSFAPSFKSIEPTAFFQKTLDALRISCQNELLDCSSSHSKGEKNDAAP